MRSPRADGLFPYTSLVVADVDLDAMATTVLPPTTPFEAAPEGIHALAWYHGHPIADLVVPGDPEQLLADLPEHVRSRVVPAVVRHQLCDALATPGGLDAAATSRDRVRHPATRLGLGAQDVTVAVCTRDRPEDLRTCLASIAALTSGVGEVLVVDNASTDERTRQVAEDFPFVRYVREPRRGLDWARNRALLEAGTAVVAFTDDDVAVHPDWVRGLLLAFSEEPGAVVVTGAVLPAELATRAQVLFEAHGGFVHGYRRRWYSVSVAGGEVAAARPHLTTGGCGTGANMALRRAPVLALGGFDPALDVGTPTGGCGDLELFFRVVAAGHLLVHEPSAVVRHRHRRSAEELARQRRGDGTGSCSWVLGAGPRYGVRHALGFLSFAGRWTVDHHLRNLVKSLLWPDCWPGELARAEAAGVLWALVHRSYRRARAQAAREAALHPQEPLAPPLVRPRARRRGGQPRSWLLDLDLDDPTSLAPAPALPPTARVLELRARHQGRCCGTARVHVGGSPPSPARLRQEVVEHFGPELLEAEGASPRPSPRRSER